ncbi:MAG: Rieske (2Fe-2S) protein [Ilumatobacteraceae bacterium]
MTDLTASLAPSDYVSDDVYRREVADIFERHWLPVCRVDQLDMPGARYAVDLAGRPLVAVRGDASIRVFANVCPHRGSTIVEPGPGRGSALVCPYHRWSFRLDGSLVGAPLAEGLDLDGVCLPEVRHTVWEGFVLVDLSGEADEPHDARRVVVGDRTVAVVGDGHGRASPFRVDLELEGDGRELDRVLPPRRRTVRRSSRSSRPATPG